MDSIQQHTLISGPEAPHCFDSENGLWHLLPTMSCCKCCRSLSSALPGVLPDSSASFLHIYSKKHCPGCRHCVLRASEGVSIFCEMTKLGNRQPVCADFGMLRCILTTATLVSKQMTSFQQLVMAVTLWRFYEFGKHDEP
jgi:hypothetical protein